MILFAIGVVVGLVPGALVFLVLRKVTRERIENELLLEERLREERRVGRLTDVERLRRALNLPTYDDALRKAVAEWQAAHPGVAEEDTAPGECDVPTFRGIVG